MPGSPLPTNDIIHRFWLPTDFDPVRPTGISSNEEENRAAIRRAETGRDTMRKMGWPLPVLASSGNGGHNTWPIDLPNNAESNELIQNVLKAFDFMFSDDKVKVDLTTSNASRIWKLYGTKARNGDPIPGRPHISDNYLNRSY